jgi:FtsZ-interacting cell division protein ZipA
MMIVYLAALAMIVIAVAVIVIAAYGLWDGLFEGSWGGKRRAERRQRAKQLVHEEQAARDAIEEGLPRAVVHQPKHEREPADKPVEPK